MGNSLFVIILWIVCWLAEGLLLAYNKYIDKIPFVLSYSNYYTVTVHLLVSFHITYAAINALFNYTMENSIDAFNTTVSVAFSLFCFALMAMTWSITYYSIVPKFTRIEIEVNSIDLG